MPEAFDQEIIRIGPFIFSTNERKTEMYIENEHETKGMVEIYPHEWDEFAELAI